MSRSARLLTLALRDLRGSLRGFRIFLACIALGVAAIAAVGNLNLSVLGALERDARRLLGGDLAIEQTGAPIPLDVVEGVLPGGSRVSRTVRTNAIARNGAGRSVAVALKAVDSAHPLVGEVELAPPGPLAQALSEDGVAVEPALLARLGLAVGDRMRLGSGTVTIGAELVREPDRLGGGLNLGPRVLASVATVERLGIILPGALVRYEDRVALPPGVDPLAQAAAIRAARPDLTWEIETPNGVQPQAARFTDRLATFLTLAGLAALITGGLGIGLAVKSHLDRRTSSIAVLKCLGASGSDIFGIFLTQVLIVAAIGTALGLVVGQILPLFAGLIPAGAVPVAPDYAFYARPLLLAAGCGLLTTLVFALWPLAVAREVPPAVLLRSLVTTERRRPRPPYLVVLAVAAAALAGLAVTGVPQAELALWFVLGTVVCLAALALLAGLFLRMVAGLGRGGGFAWRLAMGALTRPGSGSASVVVALGTGLSVLVLVALLQINLTTELQLRLPDRAPSTLVIDIQPTQREQFVEIVRERGGRVLQLVPSLRARVVRIAGVPVERREIAPEVRWTVSRDRGLTYVGAKPADVRVVAGDWWPADYAGPPLISLDAEVAGGYGVGVGDTIAFNVLGRTIEAEIANLRDEVDWSSGRLDFMFVMSPGLLEAAPHTFAASIETPPGGEPALLDRMADALPNVTPISIRAIVAQAAEVLGKIAFAVNAVAVVTLAAGLLVLAAAVASSRQRHLATSVLLKVLGARRAVILRGFLIEYGVLGAVSALCGSVLGSVSAWILVVHVMHLPWRFAAWPVLAISALAVGLALLVGGLSLVRLLSQPAAPVLRTT